jgi:hypothetical protein
MLNSKVDSLMVVEAKQGIATIETDIPTDDISAAVLAGVVVIVKGVFDPHEMRHLRALIISANISFSEPTFTNTNSWRHRREVYVESQLDILYDASFLAVEGPDDEIGRAAGTTAERLATYWRSLTGYKHTFVPEADRRALRAWAMCYPAGGGCFGWHAHGLEPTKIGMILALSELGVDFRSGGCEFRTPFGLIDAAPYHDIGDVCLFRYDLPHRVTAVDPDRERRWDGSGRWTLLIQGDPRPLEPQTA